MYLWLIRHAKSSWADPQQSDFDRPLNARGERNGGTMADWLQHQANPATWLWTSTAVRAQATSTFAAQGFGLTPNQVQSQHELYHANPEALIDVLQTTPNNHRAVAVVAHNPGLTELLNLLLGKRVTDNLPTFGIAQLRLPNAWNRDWLALSLSHHSDTQLVQLVSPKTLPS